MNGPVVVVWLRHYGWMFCKEQAAQLCGIKQDIEAAGATLAFIGNGSAAFARDFKDSFVPGCVALTDPQ